MAGLGKLERAVMDALWALSTANPSATFTAREIAESLPHHAYTTVLTVLDHLTRKNLVERIRDGKSHHYVATGSRESFVAALMHEALNAAGDQQAALVHFAETVPEEQAQILRDVFDRLEHIRSPRSPS